MARHLIDGDFDVQSKIGEIIARLDPAIVTVLINKLAYRDDDADEFVPLHCRKIGAEVQRDPSKCWHDLFTCTYDMLRSEDVDLPVLDVIFDTIEEITGMHLSYRHLDDIELGCKLDLIQEDPTTGKITRIPSDDQKHNEILGRLEMIEKVLHLRQLGEPAEPVWKPVNADTPRGVDLLFFDHYGMRCVVGKIVMTLPLGEVVVQSDYFKRSAGDLTDFYFWTHLPESPNLNDLEGDDDEQDT